MVNVCCGWLVAVLLAWCGVRVTGCVVNVCCGWLVAVLRYCHSEASPNFFIGQKEENDIEISSCVLRSERPA